MYEQNYLCTFKSFFLICFSACCQPWSKLRYITGQKKSCWDRFILWGPLSFDTLISNKRERRIYFIFPQVLLLTYGLCHLKPFSQHHETASWPHLSNLSIFHAQECMCVCVYLCVLVLLDCLYNTQPSTERPSTLLIRFTPNLKRLAIGS